jgi:hypothetical protein
MLVETVRPCFEWNVSHRSLFLGLLVASVVRDDHRFGNSNELERQVQFWLQGHYR